MGITTLTTLECITLLTGLGSLCLSLAYTILDIDTLYNSSRDDIIDN
jgi:hypothetical protein